MNDDVVIKVENVSKKYCKNLKQSMVYGLMDITRNLVGLSSKPGKLRKNEFMAVNDASFEIRKGETLGIIGPNGSGKTTLLKMLNGIFWPDKGKITVRGKVGALIAVGAGFHPQLSGRENIYINGAILGMTKKEIDNKFDDIVKFADIGDFMDTPVKNYSSGMYVRLGFSVAVHCDPEILLIDEVLAVGDIDFQAKCIKKMQEMDKQGVTKIFISHNLNSVQLLCKKTLYISKGNVKYYGDTKDVINEFKKDALTRDDQNFKEDGGIRYGTREAEIKTVDFIDQNNKSKTIFKRGEPIKIRVKFDAKKEIKNPEFVIGFATDNGATLSLAHSAAHGFMIDHIDGEGILEYTVDSLPLNVGQYAITVGCWDKTGHLAYDHHSKMYDLMVEDGLINEKIRERMGGSIYIPSSWSIK